MKIKNILKKLGGSELETRNPKPPQGPSRFSAAKELEKVARKPNDASPSPQPKVANESAEVEHETPSFEPETPPVPNSTLDIRHSALDLRNPATNRTPRGKVAHLAPAV